MTWPTRIQIQIHWERFLGLATLWHSWLFLTIEKLESWHWGLVTGSNRVTWLGNEQQILRCFNPTFYSLFSSMNPFPLKGKASRLLTCSAIPSWQRSAGSRQVQSFVYQTLKNGAIISIKKQQLQLSDQSRIDGSWGRWPYSAFQTTGRTDPPQVTQIQL